MMEKDKYRRPYCICCLGDDGLMRSYKVQNESLKILIQEEIILCHICLKIVNYLEAFVNNVQINQLILQDSISKDNVNPLITLSVSKLEPLELTGIESNGENEFLIEVKTVKSEPFVEDIKAEDSFSDTYDSQIKQDDDLLLEIKAENTFDYESNDHTILYKKKKHKKVSKKIKKKNIKETNSSKELVYNKIMLTNSELAQERKEKLTEQSYVNSLFKCSDCIIGFAYKMTYQNHMKAHEKSAGDYSCEICKQNLKTYKSLYHHIQNHYIRYQCKLCNLRRNISTSIRNHYYSVHSDIDEKMFICPKFGCCKSFRLKTLLRKHINTVHNERSKTLCKYCNKTYKYIYNHMIIKHPSEMSIIKKEKRHACEQCGLKFESESKLRQHRITHSDICDFYCVECDKKFKTAARLKAHLKTSVHLSPKDLPFKCSHCDKRFLRECLLKIHMLRVKNIRKYACDQCDKSFIHLGELKQHKKLSHEGYELPRKHICEFCNKGFKAATTLRDHKLIHTGERPYQCKICSASFNQRSILRTHTRLIHLRLGRNLRKKIKILENDMTMSS